MLRSMERLSPVSFHMRGVGSLIFFFFVCVCHRFSKHLKAAGTIASGSVLRASTSEGPEENKEPSANLIIISHLFRELMWCLSCHAALSLSIFLFSSFPSHIPSPAPPPPPAIPIALSPSSFAPLCARDQPCTRGALMKIPFKAESDALKCHSPIRWLPVFFLPLTPNADNYPGQRTREQSCSSSGYSGVCSL